MKIGIVCYPTFGGSGVVATELGKALAAKGHEIHFITYNQPVRLGSFRKNIFYHEVAVSEYPLFDYPPYELVLASKMVDVARYEKLDLLHVHYAIPHASAAYTAKKILAEEGITLPVVTTLHGTDITLLGRDSSFESVISFAINKSDAVTAVSSSLRNDTYKLFGVNKEISVIPNFVCMDQFDFEPNEELRKEHAPNGEKILTHISNFRAVKRVEDIVRIFAEVRKTVPSKLVLVGDGPERSRVEQLCRELRTCEDVIFLGKLKNPTEVLSIADVFLLPSEAESFGLAALEAMAASVPVISTNTGGLPEVNRHGVSGMMSDVGDIEDMVKNTLFLLSEPNKLEKFKKQARKRASDFDLKAILPQYEELYESLLVEG
ncbi:MAG: N-acetyl-alpha-D-glucosaminyl L-malate synthase BshA [Flavobacteriales bacterium]|nr:N-acetyl-alpha-D-glucosaminyl L-malate synthase BshA [Flavobacteriales bacterium]MDG1780645.1 N-acetyl-alpha-D-glucosaminyl L-malate synthase BshA [Flavobacteriales bacterium]MDG2244985.1 N-acetyl-alpha-D-glucosaminyl L-malate synthase BshA [Flavobacteriales bacterium]